MLRQINLFEERFKEMNMEVTTPDVLQTLSEDQLIKLVPEHDGWIIGDDPATAEVFKFGKEGRLKAAVKWGIGIDNVDFSACEKLSIPITNTPGMFGSEVSDLAMCYILGLARDAFLIDREIRQGKWPKPSGISLAKKVIGIIGLGDIGKNIAKKANAHDMTIIGWDPFARSLPSYISIENNWPQGIGQCDFIVFACALTKENYHMFDQNILNQVKNGLRVVNVSRGPLIEEEALIKGLKIGKIESAALDVFEKEPLSRDHEIHNYPKCILGSHNASNTIDGVMRASNEALRILYDYLVEA